MKVGAACGVPLSARAGAGWAAAVNAGAHTAAAAPRSSRVRRRSAPAVGAGAGVTTGSTPAAGASGGDALRLDRVAEAGRVQAVQAALGGLAVGVHQEGDGRALAAAGQ